MKAKKSILKNKKPSTGSFYMDYMNSEQYKQQQLQQRLKQ